MNPEDRRVEVARELHLTLEAVCDASEAKMPEVMFALAAALVSMNARTTTAFDDMVAYIASFEPMDRVLRAVPDEPTSSDGRSPPCDA